MERRRGQRERAIRPWLVGLAIVALAAGVGWYVLSRVPTEAVAPSPEGVPPPGAEPPPAGPTTPPTEPLAPLANTGPEAAPERPLPPLAESDPLVRELAGGLSAQPALSAWLSTTGLIERFVAVVDNIVEGESPRPNLSFLAPKTEFRTVSRESRVFVDPESYKRYDAIADVVNSLDAQRTVDLYRKLEPLCDDAYRALGHPEGNLDAAVTRAIRALLATPDVEGEVELRPKVVSYAFVDPRLERLSGAQKHFLRMGPRNVRLIKGQLQALADKLGNGAAPVAGTTPPLPPSTAAGAGRARDP